MGAAAGGSYDDRDDGRPDGEVVTALIVDDVPFARAVIGGVIASMAEFEVIAEVGSAAAAVEVARNARPQVAVVDVHMPDVDGFETCRRLVARDPEMLVVLISADNEPMSLEESERSGATGFLCKDEFSGTALRRILGPRLGAPRRSAT